MILIRLCYGASLPPTEELVKLARERSDQAPASAQPQERRRSEEPAPSSPPDTAAFATQGTLAIEPAPRSPDRPKAHLFQNFPDVVAFVGDKRDIKLKNELERYVRPVRFAKGTIEMALAEGAPQGLAGELARKLEAWTGERWIVSLSNELGEPTLREEARAKRDSIFLEARKHPVVKAVLERFPGAEVSDVHDPEPVATDPSDDSETE